MNKEISNKLEMVGREIVDSSFKVHRILGPGLLESVYEACLARELTKRGLSVDRQVSVPIVYDGEVIDDGLRLDLLVNGSVIVELKAVEQVIPVHKAQILSYLKLTKKRLGYLINFNVPLIKQGIQRFVM